MGVGTVGCKSLPTAGADLTVAFLSLLRVASESQRRIDDSDFLVLPLKSCPRCPIPHGRLRFSGRKDVATPHGPYIARILSWLYPILAATSASHKSTSLFEHPRSHITMVYGGKPSLGCQCCKDRRIKVRQHHLGTPCEAGGASPKDM